MKKLILCLSPFCWELFYLGKPMLDRRVDNWKSRREIGERSSAFEHSRVFIQE